MNTGAVAFGQNLFPVVVQRDGGRDEVRMPLSCMDAGG